MSDRLTDAREVLELRARVAELEAERWPIPGTEGDERYTAHVLLGRVVAGAVKHLRRGYAPPRATLMERSGLGSNYADALCRHYGYDPLTGARLATGSGGSDD